jgi:hypothetical protein
MADRLEFAMLGPLVVQSGGTAVAVRQAKQRALLTALLLDASRVVSVDAPAGAPLAAAVPGRRPVCSTSTCQLPGRTSPPGPRRPVRSAAR